MSNHSFKPVTLMQAYFRLNNIETVNAWLQTPGHINAERSAASHVMLLSRTEAIDVTCALVNLKLCCHITSCCNCTSVKPKMDRIRNEHLNTTFACPFMNDCTLLCKSSGVVTEDELCVCASEQLSYIIHIEYISTPSVA